MSRSSLEEQKNVDNSNLSTDFEESASDLSQSSNPVTSAVARFLMEKEFALDDPLAHAIATFLSRHKLLEENSIADEEGPEEQIRWHEQHATNLRLAEFVVTRSPVAQFLVKNDLVITDLELAKQQYEITIQQHNPENITWDEWSRSKGKTVLGIPRGASDKESFPIPETTNLRLESLISIHKTKEKEGVKLDLEWWKKINQEKLLSIYVENIFKELQNRINLIPTIINDVILPEKETFSKDMIERQLQTRQVFINEIMPFFYENGIQNDVRLARGLLEGECESVLKEFESSLPFFDENGKPNYENIREPIAKVERATNALRQLAHSNDMSVEELRRLDLDAKLEEAAQEMGIDGESLNIYETARRKYADIKYAAIRAEDVKAMCDELQIDYKELERREAIREDLNVDGVHGIVLELEQIAITAKCKPIELSIELLYAIEGETVAQLSREFPNSPIEQIENERKTILKEEYAKYQLIFTKLDFIKENLPFIRSPLNKKIEQKVDEYLEGQLDKHMDILRKQRGEEISSADLDDIAFIEDNVRRKYNQALQKEKVRQRILAERAASKSKAPVQSIPIKRTIDQFISENSTALQTTSLTLAELLFRPEVREFFNKQSEETKFKRFDKDKDTPIGKLTISDDCLFIEVEKGSFIYGHYADFGLTHNHLDKLSNRDVVFQYTEERNAKYLIDGEWHDIDGLSGSIAYIGDFPLSSDADLDDPQTLERVVGQLKQLPSGITERNNSFTSVNQSLQNESNVHREAAISSFKKWQQVEETDSSRPGLINHAVAEYQFVVAASEKQEDALLHARSLSEYAELHRAAGKFEESISHSENALAVYEHENVNGKHFDVIYKTIGRLYKDIMELISIKEKAGKQQEVQQLRAKLKPLRDKAVIAHVRKFNEPINSAAHVVLQNQVGSSSSLPLGSINIHDCICISLHKSTPEGKQTTVAHIDQSTTLSSLELITKQFPDSNEQLLVRIVGGRWLDFPNAPNNGANICLENIKKTLKFIQGKNIRIISADLIDPPANIIVDSQTFAISEAIPDQYHPNKLSSFGLSLLDEVNQQKPLNVAFNLAVSSEKASIFLTSGKIRALTELGENEDAIYRYLSKHMNISKVPFAIECISSLRNNHKFAIDNMKDRLDKKIGRWQKYLQRKYPDAIIDPQVVKEAKRIINTCAIHVGEGAEQGNQALVDVIEKLRINVNGNKATFDVSLLAKFQFSEQPFDVITKKEKKKAQEQSRRRSGRESKRVKI